MGRNVLFVSLRFGQFPPYLSVQGTISTKDLGPGHLLGPFGVEIYGPYRHSSLDIDEFTMAPYHRLVDPQSGCLRGGPRQVALSWLFACAM